MNFSKRRHISARLSLILLLLLKPCVYAVEQTRMNSGMATEMQNAFPVPYETVQYQTLFRVENIGQTGSLYRFEPQVLLGIVPQGFLALGTSLAFDSKEPEDSGNLSVQSLYNFNPETKWNPAVSLMLGTTFPTGANAAGFGVLVAGVVTKTIADAEININISIEKTSFRRPDDREFRYQVGLGIDYPVAIGFFPMQNDALTLLRTGLILEQGDERESNPDWRLEAGLFRPIGASSAVAIGSKFTLNSGTPDFELLLSFQQSFADW